MTETSSFDETTLSRCTNPELSSEILDSRLGWLSGTLLSLKLMMLTSLHLRRLSDLWESSPGTRGLLLRRIGFGTKVGPLRDLSLGSMWHGSEDKLSLSLYYLSVEFGDLKTSKHYVVNVYMLSLGPLYKIPTNTKNHTHTVWYRCGLDETVKSANTRSVLYTKLWLSNSLFQNRIQDTSIKHRPNGCKQESRVIHWLYFVDL